VTGEKAESGVRSQESEWWVESESGRQESGVSQSRIHSSRPHRMTPKHYCKVAHAALACRVGTHADAQATEKTCRESLDTARRVRAPHLAPRVGRPILAALRSTPTTHSPVFHLATSQVQFGQHSLTVVPPSGAAWAGWGRTCQRTLQFGDARLPGASARFGVASNGRMAEAYGERALVRRQICGSPGPKC
jgi:hypothetical protein